MGPSAMEGRGGLRTERLWLREWARGDERPFAAMNADPLVMEHFPSTLTAPQSLEMMRRLQRAIESDGYGFWAAEVLHGGELAGFIGLQQVTDAALPFAPAIEVGWRLDRRFWGRGFATEGGAAAIGFAFTELGVGEVLAYTAARNQRSRAVMRRLGMSREQAEDFLHPSIAQDDPLAPHVLYRIDRAAWERGAS